MPSSPMDRRIPDWATSQAEAGLRIGQTVPEIEQRLVAKGLSPSIAAAAVNAVLERHLRSSPALSVLSERSLTAHRAASALVVCLCLVLAYLYGGGESVGRTIPLILLPVVCIWWAEVFAGAGTSSLTRWVAWLVLLVVAGYRVLRLTL